MCQAADAPASTSANAAGHHQQSHAATTSSSSYHTSASPTAAAAADSDASDPTTSTSSSKATPDSWQAFFERPGRKKAPRPDAWRARMPGGPRPTTPRGRYGVLLRERDRARFERMRLVLGFYDQPENAGLKRPPPVEAVSVNNLQTLFFTRDVDPYYK